MSFSIQGGGAAPSPEQMKAMRAKMEAMAFAAADSDKSGGVSKAEFASVKPKDAPANAPSSDELFSKIDSDGDGAVTKAEFSAFGEKMSSEMMGQFASLKGSGQMPPMGPPPGKAAEAYGGQASLVSLLGNTNQSDEDENSSTIAALLKQALTTKIA